MRNKRKILLLLFFFIGFIAITYGVDPPPLPGGDPTSGGGTAVGGSAPIGSGIWYSLVLSIGYILFIFIKRIMNLKLTTHEK